MKKVLLALAVVVLAGCNSAEQVYPKVKPHGLKDCEFYSMYISGSHMSVVRCPNSSTTTTHRSGKTERSVAVID